MAIVGDITSNELKDYYYIPPSTIFPYAGTAVTTPAGWLFCDGSSYGTATYPDLFAVIGYSYGGSGTAFSVPDLRGRVIAGRDMDNGSGTAGRLSTITNQGTALAISAGAQTHTLGTAEMPSHSHNAQSLSGTTNSAGGHQHSGNVDTANIDHSHSLSINNINLDALYFRNLGYGGVDDPKYIRIYKSELGRNDLNSDREDYVTAITPVANSVANLTINNTNPSHQHSYTTNSTGAHTHTVTGTVTISNIGGSAAHNNLQPTMILNYIIKV